MNTKQIVYRDPAKLRPHKLRRHLPAIDKEMPDWIALTDSVAAGGVQQPILITDDGEGFIVDGVWRWTAAKDWQHKQIPCIVVADEDAAWIIAETLIARKQMTRGATAYLMMPIVQEIVVSAEFRRLRNLTNGRKTNEIELKPQHFSNPSNLASEASRESIKCLCIRWGMSDETFRKASTIFRWLNEPEFTALKKLHTDLELPVPAAGELRNLQEDLKLSFEHQLLTGEKNLWNVESGIKGRLCGGEHELPQKQLELFGDALDSLATRAERFSSPDKAAPEIRKWIAALETEMVEHRGRPLEEFLTKLQQVAATCEVTRKTVNEFLKNHVAAP